MAAPDVFARARNAALWAAAAKWFDVLGATVTFVAMVRLVGPDAYGIFGLALLVLLIPETIVGGSLAESLIQKQGLGAGHVSGAFLLHLILATILCAGLLVGSPLLSDVFQSPDLADVLPPMIWTLTLIALGSVPAALLQRDFRFRSIGLVDAAGTLAAGVTGISLALLGYGVWALVGMEVARRSVRAAGFVLVSGWRPSVRATVSDVQDLLHFNLATLGTRLLSQLSIATPRLFLGLVDPRALAYFNLAQRLFKQLSEVVVAPFNAVALPLAASVQDQPDRIHSALEGATRVASMIAYPIFLGAAAIAPLVIPLAAGGDWAASVPACQIMLLLGVRAATASFNGGILRGVGRPGVQMLIVGAGLAVIVVLAPLAAPFGVTAMTGAMFVRAMVTWCLAAILVERATGYPASRQFMVGWESLLSAAIMGGCISVLHLALKGLVPDLALLGALVVMGVLLHLGLLALIAPRLAWHLVKLARAAIARDRAALSALLSGPGLAGRRI